MSKFSPLSLAAYAASAALVAAATVSVCDGAPVLAPAPKAAAPAASAHETVVLAGGCFWGVQDVFAHVRGVERAVAGYAGGASKTPTYEQVERGDTGHAESVAITFDPRQIALGDILRIYFSVAHDPTQVDRQGPDVGRQYRSVIFARDAAEARFARAYIAELDAAKVYPRPIATDVKVNAGFYPAESYHQDYAERHPSEPYIVLNEAPKIGRLKRLFPQFYRAQVLRVAAI